MAYGTIKVDTIENTNGQTGNAIGPGFKNRIINGDMRIAQRGTSTASITTSGYYTVDRFNWSRAVDATITMSQETDAPTGFVNSTKILVTTADSSIGATQYCNLTQAIEGFNWADLNWGSASAKTVTLSFWVKSSLTGTFGGYLNNEAGARWYPFSYSISSANTWEYKTITIAGDTTGTWLTTTGVGVQVNWSLGVGSTYAGTAGSWTGTQTRGVSGQVQVVDTLNATWFITGVQLEVGPSATSFDYRPYGTELALCQRYYYRIKHNGTNATMIGNSYNTGTGQAVGIINFPVTMRTQPTALEQSGTAGDYYVNYGASSTAACTSVPSQYINNSTNNASVAFNDVTGTPLTAGQGSLLRIQGSGGYLGWSAEL